MNPKTKILVYLVALGILDIVMPIPMMALILIFVVLQRPTWFTDMVRDIYDEP